MRLGHAYVAAGHLADGVEDDWTGCQQGQQRACAQRASKTYARAGCQSWTPSWRVAAASAGRMQEAVEGVKSCSAGRASRAAASREGAQESWRRRLLGAEGAGLHARRRGCGARRSLMVLRAPEHPCPMSDQRRRRRGGELTRAWLNFLCIDVVDLRAPLQQHLAFPHSQEACLVAWLQRGPLSMPPLPARRNSLCLFCAFAARTPHPPPRPQRLLPRVQVACRSSLSSGSSKRSDDSNRRYRSERPSKSASFNPLKTGRRGGPSQFQADKLRSTVDEKLHKLHQELTTPAFLDSLQLNRERFDQEWKQFESSIDVWVKQGSRELSDLVYQATRKKSTLETRLRYLFYAQTCGGRFTNAELANQKEVADLRHPAEWYPATREVPRVVHMHVGPTNSGKTYHALQRLEAAKSGIYLGPLRLLAHEVFTRLNAKNKSCALVTGEEQRMPEGDAPPMYSCTVEMAPLNTRFDVAVIDEIQMINHPERGWAWSQAFLGLQAREIHLCGEARTVNIMRELCALVGDEIHIHEYERLTPLQVAPHSLHGKLTKLEKGDCLVAFSVVAIHALRREIEKQTGKKCAIVYGSLPPETRAQQAKLFNDPDNEYDFLVASDAIGMGLNL